MNDHSVRTSQDTVHHHKGGLSSMDRVPNTSPAEGRSLLHHSQVWAAGGEGGDRTCSASWAAPWHRTPLLPSRPRQEPDKQGISLLSWLGFASLTNQQAGKGQAHLHSQGWQAVLRVAFRWEGSVFPLSRHYKYFPCDLQNSSALTLATNLSPPQC